MGDNPHAFQAKWPVGGSGSLRPARTHAQLFPMQCGQLPLLRLSDTDLSEGLNP